MADSRDLFYRPSIAPPERERIPTSSEEGIRDYLEDSSRIAAELGVPIEDIPEDAYEAMINRFRLLEVKGLELKNRALFLLDRTIEDLDGYVGDAPAAILKYIEELTGRSFYTVADGKVVMKPKTDSVYTLSSCEMKCIMRAAGHYDPDKDQFNLSKVVTDANSGQILGTVNEMQNSSYMDMVMYGAKLLIIVLKMAHVIAIHYSIGYLCGFLRENGVFKTGLDIFSSFFGLAGVGSILQKSLEGAEKTMLAAVGFSCNGDQEAPPDCTTDGWQKTNIRRVNCCTTRPVFFGEGPNGIMDINMNKCFENWVRTELDPSGAGARTSCSPTNCSNATITHTGEEMAKAKEVSRFLQERPSRHGVMSGSDIQPLVKAAYNAEAGVQMSRQSQSALDRTRGYLYTGERNAPWDCFGYAMQPRDRTGEIMDNVNNMAGQNMTQGTGNTIVARSMFAFEYFKIVDDAITTALKVADRAVIGVSNLAKWGASRQLCCYVYMIVLVSSLLHTYIKKGTICTGMDIGEAMREEMKVRWARDARASGQLQGLVKMLDLIRQIVDVFRNRMNRAIFLAGLKFPLKEMWEMIKVTLANGLAQFLDIIFGPLDQVLAGIKGLPEIRMAVANECFGIDKLFDFLQCLLGNLKWGIVNWVMQVLNFSINDLTLIDDIYLCRTKMAFLDALSTLLKSMVNLIIGLRDCYDPSTLTDEIVKKEMTGQYDRLKNYYEVMNTPEYVRYADECSRSTMDQSFVPPHERIAELAGMDGSLNQSLAELGFTDFPEKVIRDTLSADGSAVDLAKFLQDTGTPVAADSMSIPVSFGEFVKIMEGQTGVRTTEIEESLRYIFDILRGQENTNATTS